ncbi:hypothetical protein AMJ80_08090 [bacterium SM23_31]|nr:MAG: hypothetical protein AMJ80_08090 [bacterium SM23_31]
MKHLSISVIIFLLFFGLASEYYAQVIKPEDLLTLELTFGSEIYGTKDEYLLAIPGGSMQVTDAGDIILSDEYKIKIYDKYGKGKKIIGRRGQGPGEFEHNPLLLMSPKGYLTAYEFGRIGYYTIYSPDYNFINKKRILSSYFFPEDWLNNQGFGPGDFVSLRRIIYLDSSVRILHFYLRKDDVSSYILMYDDDNKDIPVILNQKTGDIKNITKNLRSSLTSVLFVWGLLPGNRIFYCQNNEYEYNEKTGWEYTFHIVSLDNFEDKTFTRKFEPVPYSKSFLERVVSTNLKRFGKEAVKEREKIQKALKEKKYWPPIQLVMFDRNYVFFILNNDYEKGNNLNEVYDADADVFVSSFYAPWGNFDDQQPNIINNGYAYNLETDEDGFYVIFKYKINPAVYRK